MVLIYTPRRFSCRGPVPEPSSGGRRNFGCSCLHTRATWPSPGSRISRSAAATASKNARRSEGANGVDMRRIKLIDSSLNAIGSDMLTDPPQKTSRGPSSRRITWSCLSETFTRDRVDRPSTARFYVRRASRASLKRSHQNHNEQAHQHAEPNKKIVLIEFDLPAHGFCRSSNRPKILCGTNRC